jgi:hypothetical protein
MRTLLVLAAVVALGSTDPGTPALTEPVVPNGTPVFDISVSVVPTKFLPVQLLGRPTERTFSCSASVQEAGTTRMLSSLGLTIAPGASERKSLEVGSYSFRFSASVPATADRVETEVIVLLGSRVVSRYRGTTTFPERLKPESTGLLPQ